MNQKPASERKSAHINTKWTRAEKAEIKRAARLNGHGGNLSEFMRWFWRRHKGDDLAIPHPRRRIKK